MTATNGLGPAGAYRFSAEKCPTELSHKMHSQIAPAISAERLDTALDLLAEVMVLHNRPQFAPYVERLERELGALRSQDDVMAKARRRLEQRAANDNSKAGEGAA